MVPLFQAENPLLLVPHKPIKTQAPKHADCIRDLLCPSPLAYMSGSNRESPWSRPEAHLSLALQAELCAESMGGETSCSQIQKTCLNQTGWT